MTSLLSYPWWVTFFLVVGVLATLGAIVTLFFTLGRRPNEMTATATPPVDSEDFLQAISGTVNAPLQEGGSAEALNNGVEFYPALLDAIGSARESVNFMAYIWEPGTVSDRIFDALIERARAGVPVRLMLDAIGGYRAPDDRIEELRAAGGQVEWFRRFRFGKIMRFHKRNHRRAIIIDGKVAFTGGAAVSDHWLGDADRPGRWRDTMYRLRGCVATNVQSAFTQLWASSSGEILVGPAFYPRDSEAVEGGEALSRHVNVISSPANESHPLRKVFWLSVRAARERIYLATPYFTPDENMRDVLAERARSGVDVRVLAPGRHTDAPYVRWAAHSYYEEFLRAGVRIYEYEPTFLHAKLLVVDGRWAVIGSANLDVRSKELNQENILGILDEGFGAQLEETFTKDLEDAREVRLEEWRRRPLPARILERFFVLFAEQY